MPQAFVVRRPGGGSVVGNVSGDKLRDVLLVDEIIIGFEWLYSTLVNDSALALYAPGGVWRGEADPGAATPFVVMAHQSGLDVTTMNAYRLMSNLLYQVKAVGPTKLMGTLTLASRHINALLAGPTAGKAYGGLVSACYRESPLLIDEIVSGEKWTNIGGLYRLEIQQQ